MGGRKLLYALVTVAAVVEIVACVGDDPPAGPVKQGVRNGPCYDNNTCNAPLVCSAGTCIDSDAATNGNDASLGDAGVREEAGDGGVCSAAITSQAPSGPLCPGVDDGQCAAGTPCCTMASANACATCTSAEDSEWHCTTSSQCTGSRCCAEGITFGADPNACPPDRIASIKRAQCGQTCERVLCEREEDCPGTICVPTRMRMGSTDVVLGVCAP